MRPYLALALAAILLAASCRKNDDDDITQAACPVSDSVRINFTESVLQLMMRGYLTDTSLPGYRSAVLSSIERDLLLGAIQSVYALDISERDTVFDIYRIRTFPVVSTRSVAMKLDTSSAEAQRLAAGQPSGLATFDAVMNHYGLDSVKHYSFPVFPWIGVFGDEPYNMVQVAKELDPAAPFVWIAEADRYMGDGDNIEVRSAPDGAVEIDFSIGRGDCPAGCIYRRHWIFSVKDCSANFLRSYD